MTSRDYSLARNLLWKKQYGSSADEESIDIIQISSGGFALLATVADSIVPGQHDLLLLMTNSNGDSLCSRKFGGHLDEHALHIAESEKNLLMLGSTTSFGDNHIYMVKTDSSGMIPSSYVIHSSGRYFCEGDTAFLSLSPSPVNMHVTWSNGDTTSTTSVNVSGNYYAIVTDSLGNSFQTPFSPVYFASLPHAYFAADTIALCRGSQLIDTASSELTNSYQWYYNGGLIAGENFPFFYPQQTGSYQLVVRNYCSSDTSYSFIDSLISLPGEPVITSPPVNRVCEGDSLCLSVTGQPGISYQWYTSDQNNIYLIPGAIDTNYYVIQGGLYVVGAINAFGCRIYSFPYSVSFDNDVENVNPNGPSSFCQGGDITLTVSPGTDFHWSSGDTTSSITVNASGDYFVSFINANGCPKNSDTITITVLNNPQVNIGNDTSLCSTATLVLDAGPGFNIYYWIDGSSDQTLIAASDGPLPDTTIFYVFVTDTNGCIGNDTIQIVFESCNGISDINAAAYHLFPNPVTTGKLLKVISGPDEQSSISIKDLLSRELIKQDFYRETEILTDDLSPGVYLFSLYRNNKYVFSGKLVVK